MKTRQKNTKPIVPIFYAADENYLPYLIVSLSSLVANADRNQAYRIYVLTTGISDEAQAKLQRYADDDFTIECVNVSHKMEEVKNALQLRDYYTGATYYRIFIAEMFPQYEKALYLDSDTVILDSISHLYNTDLSNNLVGAVADGAVAAVPEFRIYTKEVLGIPFETYFNAGVLVMNLKKFREDGFYAKFCTLLKEYKFKVAQDQDYLNVICKDKVKWIGGEWNRMPIGGEDNEEPKLIHYNLTLKPWHYDNILFQEYFWEYASRTMDYGVILSALENYTNERKRNDADSEKMLRALCLEEAARVDNYIKTYRNKVA
jgi:lipopolysaccharide biosynthesis glycosyltransferase